MTDRTPLTPDMTAEEAFVVIALDAADDFVTHLDATMTDDDPHGPHQARVALRRLRTMLRAYEPILDGDFIKDMKAESRRIFRELGQIRDADILLAAARTEEERSRRQTVAQEVRETARKRLDRRDAGAFATRLEDRLDRKGWKAEGKRAKGWRKSPIGVLAGNALDHAWTDILPGKPLDQMKDTALHTLRKNVKAIRYMTEFFGPVIDHGDWRASLDALKALQDKLGQLTDMALAGTHHDDESGRATLLQEASELLQRVISLGTWWRPDPDLAQD